MRTSIPHKIKDPTWFKRRLASTGSNQVYSFEGIPSEKDFDILSTDRVVVELPTLIIVIFKSKGNYGVYHEYSMDEEWTSFCYDVKSSSYDDIVTFIKDILQKSIKEMEQMIEFYKRIIKN